MFPEILKLLLEIRRGKPSSDLSPSSADPMCKRCSCHSSNSKPQTLYASSLECSNPKPVTSRVNPYAPCPFQGSHHET